MSARRIGKFELLDELGHGGMGVVFRARDVRLDRLVALKLMRAERAGDAVSRARFLRECRAVAALNHPNIATLFEADETGDGTLYFAAELVAGRTLADHLRDGPIPVDRALRIGVELARALAAAHEKGIIHRDIKPSNVMVTPDGRVKVLDFGLAHVGASGEPFDPEAPTKAIGAAAGVPARTLGGMAGTPGYMAPEPVRGEPIGPAVDVFAAGVVLYEMTTGRRPFPAAELDEWVAQLLRLDPPRASDVNRRVPAAVASVIARCLEKDPQARYPDGAALLDALERAGGRSRRQPWTWAAAATLAATALGGGIWWSTRDTLAFTSQDRLLVADVDNRTSEAIFSGALGTALEVDLRQSEYALVVGRREIIEALELTRRSPDTRLDLQTALDLARRVGAKAVLAPSIAQLGETYQLEATLYATETGSPVDRVAVAAGGRDEVLREAVDELTASVRSRLGESLAAIAAADAPVVKVTTNSWDALETLRLGLDALDRQRAAQAAAFFEEALQRDPEFAAAKGQLALVLIQYLGQADRGKQLLAEAAATDRLSAYERVMSRALVAQFVEGNFDSALEQFRAAAGLFPSRMEPHQNQGIILRAQGRFEEAARAFGEASARAPKSAAPLGLLWFLQVGPLRDPAGAEATTRKLLALRPDDPDFSHMLGWSYLTQLRFDDAAKQLEAIVAAHPEHTRARINLAHLTLRRGDAAGAADRYRRILDDARAGKIKQELAPTALWLAVALRAAGRDAEAHVFFDEALGGTKAQARRALIAAARGQAKDALRLLAASPPLDRIDYSTAHSAASAYAFAGDTDRALTHFSRALSVNAWDVYYNLILPEMRPLWPDERFTRLVTAASSISGG